jgi:hypothetical protein
MFPSGIAAGTSNEPKTPLFRAETAKEAQENRWVMPGLDGPALPSTGKSA